MSTEVKPKVCPTICAECAHVRDRGERNTDYAYAKCGAYPPTAAVVVDFVTGKTDHYVEVKGRRVWVTRRGFPCCESVNDGKCERFEAPRLLPPNPQMVYCEILAAPVPWHRRFLSAIIRKGRS